MEFERLLKLMVEKGASDLFITAGVPPSMKVNGKIVPVTKTPLSPEQTRETVLGVMNDKQRAEFEDKHESTSPSALGALAGSGSAPFTSATCAAWCCGGLRPTFPKLKIWPCRRSSNPWP